LKKMISLMPGHKSAEKLRKELRRRLARLKYAKEEEKKKKSSGKKGIRKEGFQFVMVGKTNSGKSALLKSLTNARPIIANYKFTTTDPEIGTFEHGGVKAQVVDIASIGSEYYDIGIVNTADCLIIVVEKLDDLKEIEGFLERTKGKRIVVVNKSDKLKGNELRKLRERLKSKRIDGIVVSAESGLGLEELKGRMFRETGLIRVYMKEPKKKEKEKRPMILKKNATVKDVAEHIRNGFSKTVKETRVTGPSSKFPNQIVGLTHVMKDLDIIEFHTIR